jgi:hypothetical protein
MANKGRRLPAELPKITERQKWPRMELLGIGPSNPTQQKKNTLPPNLTLPAYSPLVFNGMQNFPSFQSFMRGGSISSSNGMESGHHAREQPYKLARLAHQQNVTLLLLELVMFYLQQIIC